MKLLPILMAVAIAPSATAQVFADWDFSSLVNPNVNNAPTVNPLTLAADANAGAGVTASDLVAVKGAPTFDGLLWAAANAVNGELNHKYWDGDFTDLTGTANDQVNDNWIAFTLTNTTGGSLEVNRLSISAWRNGAGAAGRYAFEVVADGGTAQAFATSQDDPNTADFGFDWFDFDDSVSFASTLEVRFRPVAIPGGQGTGNLHINGLRVEGFGIGTNYCQSAVNDTGSPALISATGSASILANDLVLHCGPVGTNQPGIFFFSDTPAASASGIPFGEGNRCAVGSLVRLLPPVFESGGFLDRPVDYGNLPSGASIVSGDTYYFQGWFRDTMDNNGDSVASGFNLSNALEITFLP